MKTRQMLTTLLLLVCFVTMRAQHAQVCKPCPDFARWMKVLSDNRRIYNDYNDSIYMPRDHNAWINLIRRRALRNRQLYNSNKLAIETITSYFEQDSSLIDENAYENFFRAINWLRNQETSDPFLNITFNKILERYYQTCPDTLSHAPYLNWYTGIDYFSIYNLDRDTAMLHKSFNYFMKDLKETKPNTWGYQSARLTALGNVTRPVWVTKNIISVDSLWSLYDEWSHEIEQTVKMDTAEIQLTYTTKEYNKNLIRHAQWPELMVRNIYLKDSTTDKQRGDSLLRLIVDRNMRKKHLPSTTYERTMLMQLRLGLISSQEALRCFAINYGQNKKKLSNQQLNHQDLNMLLTECVDLLYLIDISDLPLQEKQQKARSIARDVLRFFRQRKITQSHYSNHDILNTVLTYERAMKYLTEKERMQFLNEVIVSSQLPTYAHSVHVAIIAKKITESIISKEPQLLIGTNGCKTVADVKRQRDELIDLVYNGALYHDIGKCAIAPVVSDDYRPLLDEEFALIKRHSEYANRYMRIIPSLMKYRDVALGHHKWYDGRGGYPDSFDNTQSPIRTIIDIVTIADCLQAATEKVGRNYKKRLPFDEVMQELRNQAGTRYNPDVVRFINSQSTLTRSLRHQVEDGWINIYYRIYQKYFRR